MGAGGRIAAGRFIVVLEGPLIAFSILNSLGLSVAFCVGWTLLTLP